MYMAPSIQIIQRIDDIPPDLDPAVNPIIAEHWFGILPMHQQNYQPLTNPDLVVIAGGRR